MGDYHSVHIGHFDHEQLQVLADTTFLCMPSIDEGWRTLRLQEKLAPVEVMCVTTARAKDVPN